MNLFNRNTSTSRDGFCASMRARRDTENSATEKTAGLTPAAELPGTDAAPACEASDRLAVQSPCADCPWMQKGQPDLTPSVREAAEQGKWFCCHVHMGTCYGAQRYGEAKRKARQSFDRKAVMSEGIPCEKCPWTQKGQPDLTPEVRRAAVDGKWFCCHVHMGTCHGARRYGEAKAVEEHRDVTF